MITNLSPIIRAKLYNNFLKHMDIVTIITLAGLGFSLAAPLGPVNAEMIKNSFSGKNGWKYGFTTGIGAMTGDFVVAMSALFVGAEILAIYLEITWVIVSLLSANVLILGYIGIKSLNIEIDSSDENLDPTQSKDVKKSINKPSFFKQYRLGFVIVLTSPWSYGWWASFGPVMLSSGIILDTFGSRLEATIFFLSGIFLWVFLFNGLLKISHQFASPKFLKRVTQASALVLILFALKIISDIICILSDICFV